MAGGPARRRAVSYRLEVPRRVGKQIGALPSHVRDRVDAAILALEEAPRPRGSEKLSGGGDYRIDYAVDDEEMLVEILRVAHRREVYRRR